MNREPESLGPNCNLVANTAKTENPNVPTFEAAGVRVFSLIPIRALEIVG